MLISYNQVLIWGIFEKEQMLGTKTRKQKSTLRHKHPLILCENVEMK